MGINTDLKKPSSKGFCQCGIFQTPLTSLDCLDCLDLPQSNVCALMYRLQKVSLHHHAEAKVQRLVVLPSKIAPSSPKPIQPTCVIHSLSFPFVMTTVQSSRWYINRMTVQHQFAVESIFFISRNQSKYKFIVSVASTSKSCPHSDDRMRSSIGCCCDRCSRTRMPNRFWDQKNVMGTSRLLVQGGERAMGHLSEALRHSAAPSASSCVRLSG